MKKSIRQFKDEDLRAALKSNEGMPYYEERKIAAEQEMVDGRAILKKPCMIVRWSAKEKDDVGSISATFPFPDDGCFLDVRIYAITPFLRSVIDKFTPKKQTEGLKRFGPLFVNGEPTENFTDAVRAYSCLGSIPDRLSKKIGLAASNLDFAWLEGYAETVKRISDWVDEYEKNNEPREIEKRMQEHLISSIKTAIEKKEIQPAEATPDYCAKKWLKLQRGYQERLLLDVKLITQEISEACAMENNAKTVTNDDVIGIIKSLTTQLIKHGQIRPPSKSEVLDEVNDLLKEKSGSLKSGLSWEEWDLRRLNDALESLGFLWLAHPRETKRKL
jgi:hypothetical protein